MAVAAEAYRASEDSSDMAFCHAADESSELDVISPDEELEGVLEDDDTAVARRW